MHHVAVLVHACDRYEFLYKGFDIFFDLYWDKAIPTVNYFATEEKDANLKGFKNIKSGKGEWSGRLIKLLQEEIKEEYVIYMQEDMWLSKAVSVEFFKELIDYAISTSPNCVKLHSSEIYKTIPTNIFFNGLNLSVLDNRRSDFLMSHQVSLWRKDFLLSQLRKNEHPWRNERRATKRMKVENPLIHHVDYFAENGKTPINNNLSLDHRSEYYTVSLNGMLNQNILTFIKKLDELQIEGNYGNKLKFNYENAITHDGKTKPRKEDVFQKIKKWLRN
jgi:hypothetical protein